MKSYDAAIICPLKEEAAAVARRCYNHRTIDRNFTEASYSDNAVTIDLLIAQPEKIGAISSAILTTAMASRFSVEYLCVTGVCGSLGGPFSRRAEVGDVIFAESFIKFENTKFFQDELESTAFPILGDDQILAEFRRYLGRALTKSTRRRLESSSLCEKTPSIMIGPIVSTESVIKSSKHSRRMTEILRKINSMRPLAVEMEFAGVYDAAKFSSLEAKLFMIRAVNDMADENKYLQQADNRRAACENAAIISLDFISYLVRGNIAF